MVFIPIERPRNARTPPGKWARRNRRARQGDALQIQIPLTANFKNISNAAEPWPHFNDGTERGEILSLLDDGGLPPNIANVLRAGYFPAGCQANYGPAVDLRGQAGATMSCWVSFDSLDPNVQIPLIGGNGNPQVGKRGQGADVAYAFAGQGSEANGGIILSTTVLQPGEWYHLAMTHDGGPTGSAVMRLYVNGVMEAETTTGQEMAYTIGDWYINRNGNGAFLMLDARQVKDNYTADLVYDMFDNPWLVYIDTSPRILPFFPSAAPPGPLAVRSIQGPHTGWKSPYGDFSGKQSGIPSERVAGHLVNHQALTGLVQGGMVH